MAAEKLTGSGSRRRVKHVSPAGIPAIASVEELLPQRYPFLFVDRIISVSAKEIVGIKTYDSMFLFSQGCRLTQVIPGVILVESLVQCGGAGAAQMGFFEGKLSVLAALEKVRFFGVIRPGGTVEMTVKTLKLSKRLLKQEGRAFVNGKVILKAVWTCIVIEQ